MTLSIMRLWQCLRPRTNPTSGYHSNLTNSSSKARPTTWNNGVVALSTKIGRQLGNKRPDLATLECGSEEEIVLHNRRMEQEQRPSRDGITREICITLESLDRKNVIPVYDHAETFTHPSRMTFVPASTTSRKAI